MNVHDDVLILRRRKQVKHAHHGGAWKVAYADFVTALMAFFLVMWLVSASKPVKRAVAGYFRDPGIFEQQKSNGPIAGGDMRIGPNQQTSELQPRPMPDDERQVLERAAARIKAMLAASPDLKKLEKQIEIVVTREGLRIELLEGNEPTFFASGSAELAPLTERVLGLIAGELGKLKNSVFVEGHTDSRPYTLTSGYTNWELSADRANAARRVMERSGLHARQVQGIRGYADTSLRVADRPLDPRNRRVSVIVQYVWKENDLPKPLQGAMKVTGGTAAPAAAAATGAKADAKTAATTDAKAPGR